MVWPQMTGSAEILFAKPTVSPPLDPGFLPISLGNRRYRQLVSTAQAKTPIAIALERNHGHRSVRRMEILPPGSGHDTATRLYVERTVKFLLWQTGGWKIVIGGPRAIGDFVAQTYSPGGPRAFDVKLMEQVYEKQFVVESVDDPSIPAARESSVVLGGHPDGCRIGFDLGASDHKLAAVNHGETVFTTEIPWDPRVQSDPAWHYDKINHGLKLAAGHLPRVA